MLLVCVRGIIVHARYALPSVYIDCAVSMFTVCTRKTAHLLGNIEICPKHHCVAVCSPSVLSSIARFRAGFASTSVPAEDGRVRRWNRRWGKGVEGR